eukprot:m.303377 g.303377  ORF g.303377 m.303377 type:complete len:99 (-) comp16327_c1_seq9:198-494(-)
MTVGWTIEELRVLPSSVVKFQRVGQTLSIQLRGNSPEFDEGIFITVFFFDEATKNVPMWRVLVAFFLCRNFSRPNFSVTEVLMNGRLGQLSLISGILW